MSKRVFNFSAGPSTLPVEVLEEAQANLLSLGDAGVGILEISHRSPEYTEIHETAEARIKSLLGADDDWQVLFLSGGASTQFTMIPQNLGADADYVVTGTWSKKALKEAQTLGNPSVAASSEETGFDRIPGDLSLNASASFLHLTSNNTVAGTQWQSFPDAGDVPVVCDMSSDILSRPLDLDRFSLIYAGAQKNLGPAGTTLVLIRKALLERSPASLPTMLNYNTHAAKGSRFNTPPVFPIYVVGLVAKWLEDRGGLAAVEEVNARKAAKLYAAIDGLDLYSGAVEEDSRSLMNVTFRLTKEGLDAAFLAGAKEHDLVGLKGHRSVGGMRASIYNAMPEAGVDALVGFMNEFAKANS
jgi:phosphoserine aminotransferase